MLTEILEQIKKKITPHSDFEDIKLRQLLNKKINVEKYINNIYKNKSVELNDYMAKFHIPKDFKESFDRNNNSRVMSMDVKSGELLDMLLEPIQQRKAGHEKTRNMSVEWERYITENYIVFWINILKPKLVDPSIHKWGEDPVGREHNKMNFWLIKPM